MRKSVILATAALAFAPLAVLAQATEADGAQSRSGNWSAWYGCWQASNAGASSGVGAVAEPAAAPLVCVLPADEASAVRIATIVDGQITEETVVRADDVARPISEGGCSGTERAFFSADGLRVFTRAELGCTGLGRTSTGVLAMVSESEWIDAQALTVNGQHAVRAIRYQAALPSQVPDWVVGTLPRDQRLAQEAARLGASAPLGIDAVIEASRAIAPPAVEALLAERQHGFGLNAARLARLADAGVPASTIDVMVALSYPTRFAVTPRRAEPLTDLEVLSMLAERNDARSWIEECYDPYYRANRYGCRNSRYGYDGYSGLYGYSPYGYDPYGWYYGAQPVVVVTPGDERTARGAVVKGRGYTRNGGSTGGESVRRPSARSDEGASVRSSGNSSRPASSSGSSGQSAGSSSGGGGGSSQPAVRTAKPRGN